MDANLLYADVVESRHALTADTVAEAAEQQFASGSFAEGLDLLYEALEWCRRTVPPAAWDGFCASIRNRGTLMGRLLESPFTRRAYEKPRGYAGDAVLIDYIYGWAETPPEGTVSETGRRIFAWEFDSPGCRSVRARREVLARALDAAAAAGDANVLALACGHLREVELSSAAMARAFATFIAVDHDAKSLAEIERCYGRLGVTPLQANIQALIVRRHSFPDFDLIYAPGVYDYVPARSARTLTTILFGMLRPGGTLLVGNCTPDRRDIGYMQAIMDWRLLYRDEAQMRSLASHLDPSRVAAIRTFREPHQNIVFLEITRGPRRP